MPQCSYSISALPEEQDLLIANLYGIGVESFLQHDFGIEAFIDANDTNLQYSIENFCQEHQLNWTIQLHQEKDWNAIWESTFKEINIGNSIQVRAPFHPRHPEVKHCLVIAPKMAFGTGHHETTSMILEWLEGIEMKDKSVLDFGCGTGILGIYTLLCGAKSCLFVDNDPLATENTLENLELNNQDRTGVVLGNTNVLKDWNGFDIIAANITRNVILEALPELTAHLNPNGNIALSGFLIEDVPEILQAISINGLTPIGQYKKSDWCAVIAKK